MRRFYFIIFLLIFSVPVINNPAPCAETPESKGEALGEEKKDSTSEESRNISAQMEATLTGPAAEIMEKSGINVQLERVPRLIKEELNIVQKQRKPIPADAIGGVTKIIERTFYPGKLQMQVRKALEAGLNEEEAALILQWFDSPTGKTITALEIRKSMPVSMQRMEAMKNNLMNTLRGQERIEQIKTLYNMTKAGESAVDMALNVEMAISMALSGALNSADDKTFDSITQQILMKRPDVEKKMDKESWLRFLFTYRILKNSEIDAYIAFAGSNHGQKFTDILSSAFTEALTGAGREAGRTIEEYLKTRSS